MHWNLIIYHIVTIMLKADMDIGYFYHFILFQGNFKLHFVIKRFQFHWNVLLFFHFRTLPWQWSLITISQEDHSFYPMFPTDHCRRVPIFRRKVRWRSNTYDGHLSFDVAFTCSTMMRCGVYDLIVWRFKCFSSNSPPLRTLLWEVSYVCQSVWRWKWFLLPIKLRITAALALQNDRYCFPTGNRFTAAVGLRNMIWW